MKDYSPRLIPVLWAAWWTGGATFRVPWLCWESFLSGEMKAFHTAGADAVIWKKKVPLKMRPKKEVRGLNGADSRRDPNGRGFGIHILTCVHGCWRTGLFLGKTSWDGTKMEISLTWQDLISRTCGGFQVVTTGVGKLASPKFPSISERRDLGFVVFKADYLFLRFLDV